MQVSRRLAVRSDLYLSTVGFSVGMVGGVLTGEVRHFYTKPVFLCKKYIINLHV